MATNDRIRLTDAVASVATLPEGKTDVVLWDSEVVGFGLRLRENSKSWIIGYRPAGTGRTGTFKRMKIATYGSIRSVSDARALARLEFGRIARAEDPLAHRREKRRREKSRLDVALAEYEQDLVRRKYVNLKTVMRTLRTRLASYAATDISEITGADLTAIIRRLRDEKLDGAADDFRSRASAFFGWCVSEQKIRVNPLAGYRKPRSTRADRVEKDEKETGRALSDAELVAVWNSADPATSFGLLVRFLILTGCRRSEGAKLRWPMIDEAAGLINLPAIFVKQGRPHALPITRGLGHILSIAHRDARSNFVFPSWKTGRAISGWSPQVKGLRKLSGVDFKMHDLRKTFRTGLTRIGIHKDHAEMAVGHAKDPLVATYDHDDGRDIMVDIFDRWAEHVEKLLAAEKAKLAATGGKGVFA